MRRQTSISAYASPGFRAHLNQTIPAARSWKKSPSSRTSSRDHFFQPTSFRPEGSSRRTRTMFPTSVLPLTDAVQSPFEEAVQNPAAVPSRDPRNSGFAPSP